ncbi:Uncharacterized protein M6B38_237840 [Iris pallida]|uniref:Uncharacterized protein n=1 Tax=Iris pallida TaxID=29817 RepID=A0AAX6DMA2_IRIPA|nr:Uncharacterized protein M6B38_237840 [Iris pallida]
MATGGAVLRLRAGRRAEVVAGGSSQPGRAQAPLNGIAVVASRVFARGFVDCGGRWLQGFSSEASSTAVAGGFEGFCRRLRRLRWPVARARGKALGKDRRGRGHERRRQVKHGTRGADANLVEHCSGLWRGGEGGGR